MKNFILLFFISICSFLFSTEPDEMVIDLQRKAEKDDISAQYELGDWYKKQAFKAKFLSDDLNQKAITWLKQAAIGGHVSAQKNLSNFLLWLSKGIPSDESIYWMEKAANQGHADAQYLLAGMLEDKAADSLQPELFIESMRWYELAAQNGYVSAMHDKAVKLDRINASDKSLEWWRKAAINGHVGAQWHLGDVYYFGIGTTENYINSFAWMSVRLADTEYTSHFKNDRKIFYERKSKMTAEQIAAGQELAQKILLEIQKNKANAIISKNKSEDSSNPVHSLFD